MPPLPRCAARAAIANVNAPRIDDDGVAGPGESAGDGGAKVKGRAVGSSRRRCASEGVNTGAAGLSLVFVLVLMNANAAVGSLGEPFRARAVRVGLGGVRGVLEFGSGGMVSRGLLPLPRRLRRALFITCNIENSGGQRVRQTNKR